MSRIVPRCSAQAWEEAANVPLCTRTCCLGLNEMCEPDLKPGLATGVRSCRWQRCSLGGDCSSAPGCPRSGCRASAGAGAELRLSLASPDCMTDACHAAVPCLNWPGLWWVCTAPHLSPAPANPVEPSLAQPPAMCSALFSPSWKGSTTLSAPPDLLCFCHTEAPSLCQLLLCLPLCLRAIPLKGCCSCSTQPMPWLT